jgi:hypothetical protein
LSDGQTCEEIGTLLNQGTPEEELVVIGKYSFVADDGKIYTTNYRADKNGYQPKFTVQNSVPMKIVSFEVDSRHPSPFLPEQFIII